MPSPAPNPGNAVGSMPAAPPVPTSADAQQVNAILRQQQQQEQQRVIDSSLEAGMGAQQEAMEGMAWQRGADALGAATSPEVYAQYGAGHPAEPEEIRSKPSAWLEMAVAGMTSDLAKLPPGSLPAVVMQQRIEEAKQRLAALGRGTTPL